MQNDYLSVPKDIYAELINDPGKYLKYYEYNGRFCAQHKKKNHESYSLKADKKIFEDIKRDYFSNRTSVSLRGSFGGARLSQFVTPHISQKYLLKVDIVKCFNSVTYEKFEETAGKGLKNRDFIESFYFKPNLLVGLCSSALIAEVVLKKVVDSYLNKILHNDFKKQNIIFTRFYDDIYISGNSKEVLEDIKTKLTGQLEDNEFKVNTKKTSIKKIENSVILKRHVNNGQLSVGRKYKNNLRLRMHYYTADDTTLEKIVESMSESRAIVGQISYILQNETNPSPKWQKYLHKLVGDYEAMKEERTRLVYESFDDFEEVTDV